jgi:hypothetical protein
LKKDGYEWLQRIDDDRFKNWPWLRRLLIKYYIPGRLEFYKDGMIYRFLGVHRFGRYLPTGGIVIRNITKKKMPAYTLKGLNRDALKEFRYKSCLFETLHMPFFIALTWRALWWYFAMGNLRLALELMAVNAIFNIYPMMHQRYTRIRIARILGTYSDDTSNSTKR